jgi:hypothetical protein
MALTTTFMTTPVLELICPQEVIRREVENASTPEVGLNAVA